MKNAEQPINPLPSDVDSSKVECIGLTKREYFAGLCLQGILANPSIHNMDLSPTKSMTDALKVEFSIRMADELLKQLDNENTTYISYI